VQRYGRTRESRETLYDTARSLLFNADLSKTDRHLLWTETVGTAAYLRNRVPNRGVTTTTPFSEWYGKKPEVTHLRVFGATAFVRIPDSRRHKMDPKAKKMVFIGYDCHTDKVYWVFDLERKIVERVADVTIDDVMNTNEQVLFPLMFEDQKETSKELLRQEDSPEDLFKEDDSNDEFYSDKGEVIQVSSEPQKKRGRPIGSKSYQKPVTPSDRVLRDRTNKSARIAAMKVSLDSVSYEDATSRDDSDCWKQAMDDEMASIHKNKTWELKSIPDGQPAVSCRWVYKSKLWSDGTIKRYKARLVA